MVPVEIINGSSVLAWPLTNTFSIQFKSQDDAKKKQITMTHNQEENKSINKNTPNNNRISHQEL